MASHKPKRRRLNSSQLDTGDGDSEAESSSSDRPLQSGSHIRPTKNGPTGPKRLGDQKVNRASDASVFRLQLDELLDKAHGRPSHGSRMKGAEDALRKLKRVIEHIPIREPTTVSSAPYNPGSDLGDSLYRL